MNDIYIAIMIPPMMYFRALGSLMEVGTALTDLATQTMAVNGHLQ